MKWDALEEEPCSLARTIGVIGDRWTLLILRECFLRTRRFEGFQSALGITRHLLAERLKKLVRQGVLRRIPYQESPKRHEYILTQKGLDLYPIMMALVHWGDTHMVDERGRPLLHEHRKCGKIFDPVMATGMVWPWRVLTTASRVSCAARSRSKLLRSRSSKIEMIPRPTSSSSPQASSLQAEWFAMRMTPSGEVTNTASVMLPSTFVR